MGLPARPPLANASCNHNDSIDEDHSSIVPNGQYMEHLFSCPRGTGVLFVSIMTTRMDTPAPTGFITLLEQAIREADLTYYEVSRKAKISHPFLSRLLSGKRGLPADKTIAKLEKVLDLPTNQLMYKAGRPDAAAKKVLRKPDANLLMSNLAPLTDQELQQVQELVAQLAKKHHKVES